MSSALLHFAPGACSRVSLVALEMTESSFDTRLVAFMRGDHKSEVFLRLNPSGKVPVLRVDEGAISQNIAILTWLDETFPQAGILPKADDSFLRAQHLSLLSRFPSDLHPLVSRIRVPHFFCDTPGGPGRVAAMAKDAIGSQLAPFETMLANRDWLAGGRFSALDAYLHWVWYRITGAGFDGDGFPSIAAHYARTLNVPAVIRAIAHEDAAEAELTENGLMPKF